MKLILVLIFVIISFDNFQILSCQNFAYNQKDIPVIEFEKIKEETAITASQLFKNVSYIKLETRNDNILGSVKWQIGNKYIVGYASRSGFYQFDIDGKYIRKLLNFGKGPQEVYYPTWTISKDENHLIVYDQLKTKSFLCINLITGSFEKNIPIPLEGLLRNIELIHDSVLICAPISGEGNPASNYSLFWQTLSGKLIKTVPSRTKTKPIFPSENLLYRVGNQFHYRPLNSDTIFQVNGFKLEPYFIFKSNNSKPIDEIGSTSIEVYLETPDFFLLTRRTLISKEIMGPNTIGDNSLSKNYFIDKKNGKTYIINKFVNDFIRQDWMPYSLVNQNSPRKYISIEANLLKKQVKTIKSDSKITIVNQDKILNLSDSITEFDNPIIVVENIEKE
jgi:hypothetical protein